MDDASLRVSDDDRDQAVAALREHLLAGRLTLEEFSERVETALGARVAGELARVDLRDATIDRRRTSLTVLAAFGNVDVCTAAASTTSSAGFTTAGASFPPELS